MMKMKDNWYVAVWRDSQRTEARSAALALPHYDSILLIRGDDNSYTACFGGKEAALQPAGMSWTDAQAAAENFAIEVLKQQRLKLDEKMAELTRQRGL